MKTKPWMITALFALGCCVGCCERKPLVPSALTPPPPPIDKFTDYHSTITAIFGEASVSAHPTTMEGNSPYGNSAATPALTAP